MRFSAFRLRSAHLGGLVVVAIVTAPPPVVAIQAAQTTAAQGKPQLPDDKAPTRPEGPPAPVAEPEVPPKAAPTPLTEQQLIERASKEFGGVKFGLGMGVSIGLEERLEEAQLVNGVVRVTKDATSRPRLLLETHKFFKVTKGPVVRNIGGTAFEIESAKLGFGPFAALQSSEAQLLESFGLGAMMGIRVSDTDTSSFNIGGGLLLDPDVKVLGDGIVPDQPLPDGETEIRYKTESRWGFILLISFVF